ncbi:hypothetical protein AYO45_04115 [Gammaproteobacteria bacterium SCGC AG-212-F23]|nr:hypothetical protein AYO45_04115 [Gammaproteobacteria bacterium SCGC AG-212-F23]
MSKIDIHYHIVPSIQRDVVAGRAWLPEWSIQSMLEHMETNELSGLITSITTPGIYFADKTTSSATATLARECNDFSANLMQQHRGKIGSFGILPLPYIDHALTELTYCLDQLKLDGIILLTNYRKHYISDPYFAPLFEELNKRKALVFLHPTDPVGSCSSCGSSNLAPSMVEFLADTTRTVTELVYSGFLEKYPDIKFILSHGGGTIPYAASRLAMFEVLKPELKEKAPQGILYYLKKFYYDTALITGNHILKCLFDFVPPQHILFGTDAPCVSPDGVSIEIQEINKFLQSLPEQIREYVSYKTALMLTQNLKHKA